MIRKDMLQKSHMHPLTNTSEMVKESIEFLKEHEPSEGYFVGFSGGKDSICTLELCRMADVKHTPIYACTLIDPPEIYKFIKQNYPEVQWVFPKRTYWQMLRRWGPPRVNYRWCCDPLKKSPTKKIPLYNQVMGIRAEESSKRAARGRISKIGCRTHYKPIFHWKEWHIWEFIEGNNLVYPTLYDEGFSRIGCVICPYSMRGMKLTIHQKRWPQMFRIFEKICIEWARKNPRDGLDPEKIMERYYRAKPKAKTKTISEQLDKYRIYIDS
jgi:phosphoadenosine phosphosulfate reductase